ncbi:hypothetical protein MCETE4_01651 [Acidimicrobiia bacterium]
MNAEILPQGRNPSGGGPELVHGPDSGSIWTDFAKPWEWPYPSFHPRFVP